jgi:hypothetical protein
MMQLTLNKAFKHANVSTVHDQPNVVVVEATASYIPLERFMEIFNFISELKPVGGISKLIFDKRKLSVFHQPSMEWYFVDWKEKMYDQGLRIHRKILPRDDVFRQSVRIGRDKIAKAHPTRKFNLMDIQYCESLEEALTR